VPLTFANTIGGTATERDVRAAIYAIDQENVIRAAATPPGTPLLKGTQAQIKASLETIMAQKNAEIHQHNLAMAEREKLQAAAALFEGATDAGQAQAIAILQANQG